MSTMTVTETLKTRTRQLQARVGVAQDGFPGPVTVAAALSLIAALRGIATASGHGEMVAPGDPIFDDRTERNLATLTPAAQAIFRPFIARAKQIAADYDCAYVAIGGDRTCAEQNALYAQGRTKPGPIVTNAKCGQSNHNYGIALDFGVFDQAGRYLDNDNPTLAAKVHREVGQIASAYQLDWGGNWTSIVDYPHFELSDKSGKTLTA